MNTTDGLILSELNKIIIEAGFYSSASFSTYDTFYNMLDGGKTPSHLFVFKKTLFARLCKFCRLPPMSPYLSLIYVDNIEIRIASAQYMAYLLKSNEKIFTARFDRIDLAHPDCFDIFREKLKEFK